MDYITWEDFAKVEIRVGTIVTAEIPEGSNKLIKYKVDFGELGEKTIFSGIQKWFTPDELVGKQTAFVVNLATKKMGTLGESEGMLLAGEVEGRPVLVSFGETLANGTRLI
jgi:methionyl-tRNA synthetase